MKIKSRTTKVTSLLFPITALLFGAVARLQGQAVLDSLNPNANGAVRAVAVQTDGKILLGGDFTTLSPNGGPEVTRNHIARLNPDGTLDSAFNPDANNNVRALAIDSAGKVIAGGDFTSIGGEARNHLVRLDATSGAADSFSADMGNIVRTVALQADGKILIGGDFTRVGEETRYFIARLDATTGLPDEFDPKANGSVHSIAIGSEGNILVGGQFNGESCIGGATRNYFARLDPATGLADSLDANANGPVLSVAVQPDGKILVAGFFHGANSIGGQTRNRIARLNGATGAADSFNPNADGEVISIAVQADGKILAGGRFRNIGGQTRNYLARLDATTGATDGSFTLSLNGVVHSIVLQGDGKILVGGGFGTINDQTRNRVARLMATND